MGECSTGDWMHCQPGSGRSLWCTADSSFSLFSHKGPTPIKNINITLKKKIIKALNILEEPKTFLFCFKFYSSSCPPFLSVFVQQTPVVLLESLGSSVVQTSAFYCSLTWLRPLPFPSAHHHAQLYTGSPLPHYLWKTPLLSHGRMKDPDKLQTINLEMIIQRNELDRSERIPMRSATQLRLYNLGKSDIHLLSQEAVSET